MTIKIIVEAVEKLVVEYRDNHGEERKRLQAAREQLDKELENLAREVTIARDVPELARQLQEKAKRRLIVAEALDGLEDKVRAKLQDIRDALSSSDVHELRAELKRHISSILVDAQRQMRIKGAMSGALDAATKMVAGAGLEPATSRL